MFNIELSDYWMNQKWKQKKWLIYIFSRINYLSIFVLSRYFLQNFAHLEASLCHVTNSTTIDENSYMNERDKRNTGLRVWEEAVEL